MGIVTEFSNKNGTNWLFWKNKSSSSLSIVELLEEILLELVNSLELLVVIEFEDELLEIDIFPLHPLKKEK